MRYKSYGLFGLVFVLLAVLVVQAQTPPPTSHEIPFSGTAPGQSGPTNLTFKLYNARTGGVSLNYTDSQVGIEVTDEAFNAVLGEGSGGDVPTTIFVENSSVYIAIELTSNPGTEIAPRVPIYSSGFAHNAQTAKLADTAQSAHIAETLVPGATVAGSRDAHILSLINNGVGNALFADNVGLGQAGEFRALNPKNISDALRVTSNGLGNAVLALNTGSGGAGQFEIQNEANDSDVLFARTNARGNAIAGVNTGTGRAGQFEIQNTLSNSDALSAKTDGVGSAVAGLNTGKGLAGEFENRNRDNGSDALLAKTNGSGSAVAGVNTGTGRAGEFEIKNAASARDALFAKTDGVGSAVAGLNTGGGRAGEFESRTPAAGDALLAKTEGILNAIVGLNTGPGRAGKFEIQNAANRSEALAAMTNGNGRAGTFQVNNLSNQQSALFVSTNGSGAAFEAAVESTGSNASAGTFHIDSNFNTKTALVSRTVGTGRAGDFRINNLNNRNPALAVSTNGSGEAIMAQSSSGVTAVKVANTGQGRALSAINTSSGFPTLQAQNNTPTGRAALFLGNVEISPGNLAVSGTLSKGSGSFKIDHPVDPEHKYLYHSFVESPDMMNIYNGNIVLDARGEAWVELPQYFEALNKDFRYQLTAIGAPGPNLYIDQEISSQRFKIAGGQPGLKVSWQVTGIRKDPFAEAHRIIPEVEKEPKNQGKYLHPKEWGKAEELGTEWEETKRSREEAKVSER